MTQKISAEPVRIPIGSGEVTLMGDLTIPDGASAMVVFAHGSGSSRLSPRNRYIAEVLQETRLATLLFDLLTVQEEQVDARTRQLRFDVELLRSRLIGAVDWVLRHGRTRRFEIGLLGTHTGAAAALATAAARPAIVRAVVSRGGRLDLASSILPAVKAPTLLIVGELDTEVLDVNRRAVDLLRGTRQLEILPRASHLFTEPGKLEQVADLASNWFHQHLVNRWQEFQATARLGDRLDEKPPARQADDENGTDPHFKRRYRP